MLDSSGDPANNLADYWQERSTREALDLVVEGFSRLISQSEVDRIGIDIIQEISSGGTFSALSIHQINSQEDLLHRLHSHLLPLLNNQINTLSLLLIPSGLWKEPARTIKLILQTQTEFQDTIDQFKSIITTVCRGITSEKGEPKTSTSKV
ncbi:hypothetical protein PtA15_18A228 [Puccinia triticina]|uniref:Uncharacterized protein n=1 Tax=Puccinia triticina TaxID=208348 RepID=A0ABY7DAW4_9BASI|nr:uncharacterized protein PtA15_18A228 [Puccinia triticina]WAQ93170.1 hypothetical protein PtA15_18A228 [Puccinia triticina]